MWAQLYSLHMANSTDIVAYVALTLALVALAMSVYTAHKLSHVKKQAWDMSGVVTKAWETWGQVPPQQKEEIRRRAHQMAQEAGYV